MSRMTKSELEEATADWINRNRMAFFALEDAVALLSDEGKPTPYKFLMELLRFSSVLGKGTMHRLVDLFAGVSLAKSAHAIPNEVTAGVSRRIDRIFAGREGYSASLRHSILDDPDPEDDGQLALF